MASSIYSHQIIAYHFNSNIEFILFFVSCYTYSIFNFFRWLEDKYELKNPFKKYMNLLSQRLIYTYSEINASNYFNLIVFGI